MHSKPISDSTYLVALFPWPLALWLGTTYTDYPNQIHWAYSFGLLVLGCILFPHRSPVALMMYDHARDVTGLLRLWALLFFYLLAFYIVSSWELYPGTSVAWGKFEIVQFAVAANFYVLGRVFSEKEILTVLHWLGVALVVITIVQLLVDNEVNRRYGYGWQLMLCLPASLLLRKHWFIVAALMVMTASRHKAALAAALLALGVTYIFAKMPTARPNSGMAYNSRAAALVCGVLLVSFTLIAFPAKVVEAFEPAVSRLIPDGTVVKLAGVLIRGEEEDPFRQFVVERSAELLQEHLPQGMGYMNFSILTGLETGVLSNAGRDREFFGFSLHNSYMTWILEGGVLVTAVVLLIFWGVAKRIVWLRRNAGTYNFAALCLAWAAACLLIGMFHQLHSMMQFWGTIGLIYGYCDHHRALPSKFVSQHSSPQHYAS